MNKTLLALLIVSVTSSTALAANGPSSTFNLNAKALNAPTMTTIVDKNGNPQFYALGENGQYRQVDASFVANAFVHMIEAAKAMVCNLKTTPASITISAQVFSATWNRDDLCKSP